MKIEINDIVSPELVVTPLEEGQTATYKLCDVDLVDHSRIDEQTGKPKNCSPRRSMVKSSTIFDPFARKNIIIQNIIGMKFENDANGLPREVPELARVIFPRTGALTLTHNHPGTYAYLERHPRNRDNPFRDKSKIPLFYRLNAKRKAITDMEGIYLKADALDWIKRADLTELKSIYSKLDPTSRAAIGTSEPEILKRDLFKYADLHPQLVLKASKNKIANLKIQIMDAEYFNIIAFFEPDEIGVTQTRRWVFTGKTNDVICELELTVNKYDGLVNLILDKKNTNRQTIYNRIVQGLQKIVSPNAITKRPAPIKAKIGHDEDGKEMEVSVASID